MEEVLLWRNDLLLLRICSVYKDSAEYTISQTAQTSLSLKIYTAESHQYGVGTTKPRRV